MARPRSFDEAAVVDAAAACFTRLGYAATSVDDLVGATGLHRGSLYGAFGSKRGLFVTALSRAAAATGADPASAPDPDRRVDLLLVAALELAPHDAGVRDAVAAACGQIGDDAAALLGRRLLRRAGLDDPPPAGSSPTDPPTHSPTDSSTRRT